MSQNALIIGSNFGFKSHYKSIIKKNKFELFNLLKYSFTIFILIK